MLIAEVGYHCPACNISSVGMYFTVRNATLGSHLDKMMGAFNKIGIGLSTWILFSYGLPYHASGGRKNV